MPAAVPSDSTEWPEKTEPGLIMEASYHGFLPSLMLIINICMEDIGALLNCHGDYLVRMSEVDPSVAKIGLLKGSKKQLQLVLSVLNDPDGKCAQGPIEADAKVGMIRNLIIQRSVSDGVVKFAVLNIRFSKIKDLLAYYKKNPLKLNNASLLLVRATKLAKWEYYHKDISVGTVLGKGAFGEVKKGTLRKKNGKTVTVAIKQLASGSAISREKIEQMMQEARLMRGLSHPNVVKIYGAALTEQPLYILLEFVQGGALDSYLKKNGEIIDRDEKMQMCMGACWGLTYLHDQGIVHRDVAARNCLYDSAKNVKISDFGLSRVATIYYMKKAMRLPIKWMAPESVANCVFSQKTDVYSLGIMFYEVMAGEEPYSGMANADAKKEILDGRFPAFPESIHLNFVQYVNEKIFDIDPSKRANMQHITQWMETFTGLSMVVCEDDKSEKPKSKSSKTKKQRSADKKDKSERREKKEKEASATASTIPSITKEETIENEAVPEEDKPSKENIL